MTVTQQCVYVVEALHPNGGTYMAYHVGAIVHQNWGYELVVVSKDPRAARHQYWNYQTPFRQISIANLPASAEDQDLLIANPSFSDNLFGLKFAGRKLMYVQGFNTCSVIDGFYEKYVAVSPFVQQFLLTTYGLDAPVIEPFIHHEHAPQRLQPWHERPKGSVVTVLKRFGPELTLRFKTLLREHFSDLEISMAVIPRGTPHKLLMYELAQHRYFLSLSPLEGFGLLPLEAMHCGCAVIGFHGCGGLAYMEDGHNAIVCAYPDLAKVVMSFGKLASSPSDAQKICHAGVETAHAYTYHAFRDRWMNELTDLLGAPIALSERAVIK